MLPFFHLELALCHENGPKIVSFGFTMAKNGRFLPTAEISARSVMSMTQRYIEGDTDAKRKLIALI